MNNDRLIDELVRAATAAAMIHSPPLVAVALHQKLRELTIEAKAALMAPDPNTTAAEHVQEALSEVDKITRATRKGYLKPYTLNDAQGSARAAAAALRRAWDLLEPTDTTPPHNPAGGAPSAAKEPK